jgi:glucosamine--fructose-6-phosphate aminotransferase (isomerizing)
LKKLRKNEKCKLEKRSNLNQVIGAYAIAVIDVDKPDEIVGNKIRTH